MLISLYRFLLRILLSLHLLLVNIFTRIGKSKSIPDKDIRILLTGTFYSDQWIDTHLRPLAMAENVKSVQMVSVIKGPEIEGVEYIIPSYGIRKLLGEVPSRLLIFCIVALRTRPNVIGGFHLLINGLVALLVGRIIGAVTLYICGGGAREVLGGGYLTENKIFKKIGREDKKIEGSLLHAVGHFDVVVVMGQGALNYFRRNGVSAPIYINAGGFDGAKYNWSGRDARFDIIFIGRISRVKRIDLFIEMVARIKSAYLPTIKAVILGDGPERTLAENIAREKGLDENIYFAGWQSNVWDWLKDSKLFVLTSDSEGLSQAMIQAMMCGLPAVVSDVGDLSDLVTNNENGYLIKDQSISEYVQSCAGLLIDNQKYSRFRKAALRDSTRFELNNAAKIWADILSG